jgi:lysine 6-dehydrogenase
MRIVVVGAAGEVGKWVARDLAASAGVEEVVLADLDREGLATVLDGWPVVGAVDELVVEPADQAPLAAAVRDAEVLMDCSSFGGSGMLDLAIAGQTAYADLISTRDQDALERARRAGIAAVSGLGQSPGLSNVLAGHAAAEFDQFDEFHVYWASYRSAAASRGGLDTITWELGNACPEREYYLNGRWVQAGFMEMAKLVDFGVGMGETYVYAVPHPEVREIVSSFPSLRYCSVLGTWQAPLMAEFKVLNEYGLLEADTVEDTKRMIWKHRGGRREGGWQRSGAVACEARGTIAGKPISRRYDVEFPADWGDAAISRGTGLCAGVGAELIGRRGAGGEGFVNGEVFFDAAEFLETLRARDCEYDVHWVDNDASDEFETEEK